LHVIEKTLIAQPMVVMPLALFALRIL